jgi:YYY domain-containing protein
VVFNLALPTVLANAAVSLFALAHLLAPRLRWLPLLTLLVVNPSFLWNLFQGKALGSVLWDSTRTIPNTINEYPIFSFVWGDLHAHVISLFNQAFLLFVLVYTLVSWEGAGRRERIAMIGLTALSLGSMPLINSWDVILYAPVTVVFGLLVWHRGKSSATILPHDEAGSHNQDLGWAPVRNLIAKDWSFLICVPLLSVLIYAPFYLQMTTPGIQGIGLVHTPTPVSAFLLVHGIFIALFFIALYREILKRPYLLLAFVPFALAGYTSAGIAAIPLVYFLAKKRRVPADLLAIFGLTVIILCEFLYLKDNMGETYYRMNTVFKFYLPAWILMGAAGFSMAASLLASLVSGWEPPRNLRLAFLAGTIALLLISPLVISFDYQYRDTTLDGLAYLSSNHPGDAEAVAFLRSLDGVPAVVEAEGGDYTYYSRISSFTGIPTIIGMPFHEFMWRADGWFGERTTDVRLIYEDPGQTRALMEKYNATHLYVGDAERERYDVRVERAGLPLLYNRSGVQIYRISD